MKDKNITTERAIIVILFFVTLIMFSLGCYFLYGWFINGSLIELTIAGVLVFICGYALIVFIKKLHKQNFYNKIETAIEKCGAKKTTDLATKYKKSEKEILIAIKYLKDNNYLNDYFVDGTLILNVKEEELKQIEYEKKQRELEEKILQNQSAVFEAYTKEITESCDNCGAIVKFKGDRGICPYCGSPVKRK